jgi:hypothetical protein
MLVTVATSPMHAYEIRPRKDHRGVDLISNSPKHGEEPSPQHP